MRKEILRIIHGITPAYAGKREGPKNAQSKVGDHPRVCGEKCIPLTRGHGRQGSPPRMRGKGVKQSNSRIRMGITPAYAGKSSMLFPLPFPSGDHPRVCGEKRHTTKPEHSKIGSPPRMRGKVFMQTRTIRAFGITPAYAGKSTAEPRLRITTGDHPRVCGEKTKKIPSHRPFQLHPVPVSFSFA